MPAVLIILFLGVLLLIMPHEIERSRALKKLNQDAPAMTSLEYHALNETEQAAFWKKGGKIR